MQKSLSPKSPFRIPQNSSKIKRSRDYPKIPPKAMADWEYPKIPSETYENPKVPDLRTMPPCMGNPIAGSNGKSPHDLIVGHEIHSICVPRNLSIPAACMS